MYIPSEPSLLQNEVQILLIGPGCDNVLQSLATTLSRKLYLLKFKNKYSKELRCSNT